MLKIAHLRKIKNPLPKACLVTPEIPPHTNDVLKVIITNPHKSKHTEKKESDEIKKTHRDRKESISKGNIENIKSSKGKPPYKSCKSALSIREEMIKKYKKESKHEKNTNIKTDETPIKKRIKKKTEKPENSQSAITVKKPPKEIGIKKQLYMKKASRKKSKEKDHEKKTKLEIKFKSQFKNLESLFKKSSEGAKKCKNRSKKKLISKNRQDE